MWLFCDWYGEGLDAVGGGDTAARALCLLGKTLAWVYIYQLRGTRQLRIPVYGSEICC